MHVKERVWYLAKVHGQNNKNNDSRAPVILVLRRQRSGGSQVEASLGKYFSRSHLTKTQHNFVTSQRGKQKQVASLCLPVFIT
jgi:hypothetical protein